MNPLRELRFRTGLTQQELAAAAGTSQSAIAAYESGAKSPTLRTVDKLAASLGMEFVGSFVPRMTREDRRSLAFHRAIAELVKHHPESVIPRARQNLARLRKMHPHAAAVFDGWCAWLDLPPQQLALAMLDPGLEARDMRQVSPFSGILPAKTRAEILRRFRREDRV